MTDDGPLYGGPLDDGAGDDAFSDDGACRDEIGSERPGNTGADESVDGTERSPDDPIADDPIAAEMSALFAVVLSDEPQSRVSPLSVIAEAGRGRAIRSHRRRTWLVGVAAAAVLITAGAVVVPRMLPGGDASVAGSGSVVVGAVSDASEPGSAAAAAPNAAPSPESRALADQDPAAKTAEASRPTGPESPAGPGYSVATEADQAAQPSATVPAGSAYPESSAAASGLGSAPASSAAAGSADAPNCAWTALGADAVAAARAALPAGSVGYAASLSGPCDPVVVAAALLVPVGEGQSTAASATTRPVGVTVTITREGPAACLRYPAGARCLPTAARDAFAVGTQMVFVYVDGLQAKLDLHPASGMKPPTVGQLAAAGRAVLATLG